MICRYCGRRIVWMEGQGWLHSTPDRQGRRVSVFTDKIEEMRLTALRRQIEAAIGYEPITASWTDGTGAHVVKTHMAVVDRDRIVEAILPLLAAGAVDNGHKGFPEETGVTYQSDVRYPLKPTRVWLEDGNVMMEAELPEVIHLQLDANRVGGFSVAEPELELDPAPYYVVEDHSRRTSAEVWESANDGSEHGGTLYNLARWLPRKRYEQDRSKYPEEKQ